MTRKRDTDDTQDYQQELDIAKDIADTAESETPTSSDVGKQTLTKADLGYDPRPPVDPPDVPEGLKTPRHPDDPSGDPENQKVNVDLPDAS
jgi:hypothetical protein